MKKRLSEEHRKRIKETMLERVREGNQKGLFQKGHIPFYKGKEMPQWARENMSKGRIGMKLSEEHKRNISLGNKGHLCLEKTKEKISNTQKGRHYSSSTEFQKGHQVPMEWAKKVSEVNKGKHSSPSTEFKKGDKGHLGYKHSKETIEVYKEKRKNWVTPSKDTTIEVKIQNFLKQLGIEFYTHQHMNIEHEYQCDILIPSLNIVIECYGNYWHKYPYGRKIDIQRCQELKEKGYKVLVFWENEIKFMELNDLQTKIKEVTN